MSALPVASDCVSAESLHAASVPRLTVTNAAIASALMMEFLSVLCVVVAMCIVSIPRGGMRVL